MDEKKPAQAGNTANIDFEAWLSSRLFPAPCAFYLRATAMIANVTRSVSRLKSRHLAFRHPAQSPIDTPNIQAQGTAQGTIPNSYRPAEWRNTTPVDSNTNRIGVGFDMHDGTVIRLAISDESARHLAETLLNYLTRSHSPMSSGMPSVEVSTPFDGVKV